ncbi:MAG: excinuclease ABC subunit C, partial [Ignavibacteriales bacterium]|nr:excinuclease ABC subunit C [Ignavibacteriales bacterium]
LTDRDIFAVASEGDDACGVVFNVREGKIVNRKHIYMNGVQSENKAEVLEQFLERYYLETEDIPSEILLPIEVQNMPTIQEWLSKKSGENTNVKVPKIGEKAKLVGMCWSNAKLLLEELKIQKHKQYIPHSVSSLQRDIRLPKLPRRIECFDISNIQGTDSVASMVVFIDGKPKKSEYRRYKIESVYGPDDFASIREVIKRRYEHLEEDPSKIPNLIVVDGGKGQLSSAVDIINNLGYVNDKSEMKDENKKKNRFQIIGLAKKLEEIYIPNASEPITIPRTSSGLRLLQRIRNEAHRFAIEYHRTLRKKRVLQTELEVIAGIGKKRAIKLLNFFGSVQGVKSATYEQLKEVVGEDLAENIKNYYQD